MPLSDLFTPVVADQLAKFGPGTAGTAAQLNYDVPLPGAYSWDRIVPIELPEDWFDDAAARQGASLVELGVVQGDDGRLTAVNRDRLAQLFRRTLPAVARPSLRLVAEVGGDVMPLLSAANAGAVRRLAGPEATTPIASTLLDRRAIVAEPEDVEVQRLRIDSYLQRLADTEADAPQVVGRATRINFPAPGIGSSVRPIPVDPVARPVPRLALVETWELRSYLGDYGLGRTLQTFSLLPGERTMISVQTWRTDSATREDASSIFDSSDSAAQTRFTSALETETGSAFQDQGGWALSVSTSASAGLNLGIVSGGASVSTGFAANHQEASQRWSNQISNSTASHASQVNSSRRQSVESTSSTSTASGASTTTVRELTNTNLRRVLNFVFRELNQTYETYVVLRDIKVAFYNGRPGSAEIVPLADIGSLLRKHVAPAEQAAAARAVLALAAQRIDANGDPVTTLQLGANPRGVAYDWRPAELDAQGQLEFVGDPLASDVRWRFAPGPLSKDDRSMKGVIMDRSSIVLRTDNLVAEALLGQADALDPYESARQALDLQDRQSQTAARDASTEKVTDALALVDAQADSKKIEAWEHLFPDGPEIQVVPVASVNGNGGTP